MVNRMCMDCRRYKDECPGTKAQFWTGCIWKERAERKPEGEHKEYKKKE